jgi:acetate kinase
LAARLTYPGVPQIACARGGIGEHSGAIRAEVVNGMAWLGLTLDE